MIPFDAIYGQPLSLCQAGTYNMVTPRRKIATSKSLQTALRLLHRFCCFISCSMVVGLVGVTTMILCWLIGITPPLSDVFLMIAIGISTFLLMSPCETQSTSTATVK